MDLRQLEAALRRFSDLEPTHLPLHHVLVFLVVARSPGCCLSYPSIGEQLGLASSSVSRTVAALSDTNRHGEDGHGLLYSTRDPEYGRRFVARLTNRGRSLVRQLELI